MALRVGEQMSFGSAEGKKGCRHNKFIRKKGENARHFSRFVIYKLRVLPWHNIP